MIMKNGIFIDLGHGGNDSGAVGKSSTEAMLVLEIGKELNNLLLNSSVKYRFSRLEDRFLTLQERCNLANNMKADIFLSIHINSAKNTSATGTEAWIYSLKNNKVTIDFAAAITNELSNTIKTNNRGVKVNPKYTVLKNTRMKALILEVGFISNANQEQVIKENIKAIARTIYLNILSLYGVKEPEQIHLYKVCIGAFANKDNAIKFKNEAISKGFEDTYII